MLVQAAPASPGLKCVIEAGADRFLCPDSGQRLRREAVLQREGHLVSGVKRETSVGETVADIKWD
jgi:hypothetical protein